MMPAVGIQCPGCDRPVPRADAACECGYTPREAGRLPAAVALVVEVVR
jgi:hypothetical protein